ncbi:ATP-binding protein [uncultured Bacteroides sp.]|uniref:ATP-binding protein n=1 Tax=uncultured Bacteroides sp. TaxID=162156 RepID=UPI0025FDBBFD|nr:ATP-binding protein [uncultured Bacteroides sp.]
MKYPIGIQTFGQIREDGYVYVDKTALIYQLVTTGKIYFLSRPRRFGKSLLVSTLEAYYLGRKELFEGLAIAELEKDWLEYPIFRIDFNGGPYMQPGILEATLEGHLANWEDVYGKNPHYTTTGDRFRELLRRASEQAGRRAVVLIDEYDKPILDALDTPQENVNRELLKMFYSTFKSADASLQFVLLTGVTKFSQVSVFSGFNQPKDISMDARFETLCGITQQEIEHYFAEPIAALAEKYQCSVEEMKDMLRQQYDGYHFSDKLTGIYNPFSVLNAFDQTRISDFWYATGTPTYLEKLLKHNHEQINELTGKYYAPAMFVDYKADVEKPLPMIYQSGYLTIKDYDMRHDRYLLDFPNNEVRQGFLTMIANSYLKPKNDDISSWITDAIILLEDGETAEFRDSLTAFLSSIPYDSHDSLKSPEATEKYFQYTFYLILRLIGEGNCRLINEKTQSMGRVDCIIELKDYVYIFEFKLNGSADEALRQIQEKNYAKPYLADKRKVICIGVNFSSETRTVEEWKEVIARK